MTAKRIGLSLALITAIAGFAATGEAKPKVAPKAGVSMPAADIIAGRKAGMLMSASSIGAIKAAVDRGDDPKSLTFAVTGLAAWAKATVGQFPKGSEGGEAKAAIWTDAAGFKGAADQYAADTAALVEAAKSGDKAKFTESWSKVRGNCAACHGKYKTE
jgi:cytochrome c556